VAARTWYCNWETELGVRLVLPSKKDSSGGAAHRCTKKEARRCSGFGDGGAASSVSAMPGRRRLATAWRGASTMKETKWLGGEGAVAPVRSSCDSAVAEKSMALLELRARAVTR
jgi:hypothetical protein